MLKHIVRPKGKVPPFAWLAFFSLLMLTGCKTSVIPVEVSVPGDFNISGVSKIVLADFNTVQDDSRAGIVAADKKTISLVQDMVASAFSQSGLYQVADLDIEKNASEMDPDAKLANRFDAVLYGRLWWQSSPDYQAYPRVDKLEAWRYVKYTDYEEDGGKSYESVARLTTKRWDEYALRYFRARKASLMLSLSLYRLDRNGRVEKIADTFNVANLYYSVDDGAFREDRTAMTEQETSGFLAGVFGKALENSVNALVESFKNLYVVAIEDPLKTDEYEVSKKVEVVRNPAVSIPTELQIKLMLTEELSKQLVNRFSPSKEIVEIPNEFSDSKLSNLLGKGRTGAGAGAFRAAKDYILYSVRKDVGNKIADEIDPLRAYDAVPAYLVPAKDPEKITDAAVRSAAGRNIDYLYALAICEEAQGEYEQALNTYRYLFYLDAPFWTRLFNPPEKEKYAEGISRCLYALRRSEEILEKERALRKALQKTRRN
jgi:hypothetical protein